MVQANYRMLHDQLKIAHAALITGVSMGGTQTYVWGVMHITTDQWLNIQLAQRAVERVPGAELLSESSPSHITASSRS